MSNNKNENGKIANAKNNNKPAKSVKGIHANVFSRGHSVDPKTQAVLERTYKGWTFEFGSNSEHPHPMGAAERAICEELAYRDIQRNHGSGVSITDIGGNANRHCSAGRLTVHSCNPILSSDDAVRRHPTNYKPEANYCSNTSQQCPFTPDVYLSVHSLYYLKRDDILDFVYRSRTGNLYAVVHRFDNLYGTYHDNGVDVESSYQIIESEGDIKVAMKVRGNPTAYIHDPCLWLSETYYEKSGRAMAWTGYPVGDSWIYRFTTAPNGLDTNRMVEMPLVDSLNRDDHHGTVNGVRSLGDDKRFKPTLEFLKISNVRFISCGGFTIVYRRNSRYVLVPKQLIRSVALKMVGLPRTKDSLKLCTTYMKQEIKHLDMPISMKIDCAIYGSAMAFTCNLADEIEAFNSLCSPTFRRMFDRLSKVMELVTWDRFVCCGNMAEMVEANVTVDVYNADRSSVPGRTFNVRKAWPEGLPGVESCMPLRTMKTGASYRPAEEPELKEPKPQMHSNCITFSNHIPVVSNPSFNNEEKALVNRALVDTPPEDLELWDRVRAWSRDAVEDFSRVSGTHAELFQKWNAHYPPKQREINIKALHELNRDGLNARDLDNKMFVKREVLLKGGPIYQDFDPRAIQGCSPKANVAFGPFIWHMSKILSAKWNPDHRICYTSGMTAEQIGNWRASFSQEDVTIVELDESRYDAHQGEGAYTNSNILKYHCGIEDYPYAKAVNDSLVKTKGWTYKGSRYSVPYTMTSGRQDTSVSNSFNNGTKLDFLLDTFGLDCEYKMLVHGDDSLVVIRKKMSPRAKKELENFLVEMNLRLGFSTKCKVSDQWHEVEYCSSLFWPTSDGYVLGPKIGKRLPKIGFGIRPLNSGETKAMLMGLALEAGFVPVIRKYAEYASSLLKEVKIKEFADERKQYKSLATTSHTASDETNVFFMSRYGFDIDSVEEIFMASLAGVKSVYDCVDFPLMEIFTDVDLS